MFSQRLVRARKPESAIYPEPSRGVDSQAVAPAQPLQNRRLDHSRRRSYSQSRVWRAEERASLAYE